MNAPSIVDIVSTQRKFFESGQTHSIDFRKNALKKLLETLSDYESKIFGALKLDLNRSDFETFVMEIGVVREEIHVALKNLDSWAKTEKVPTSIIHFWATSEIIKEPLGLVLDIGPWNYPFQLSLAPLISAVAAGNCVVLKPSELAPNTANLLSEIVTKAFLPEHVTCVVGGISEAQALLREKFDHIFFTGGINAGRAIMLEAAKQLTPVTLELGGKSPCIVDSSADIRLAAKRIGWGKFTNAGQTCVAPDYILIHKSIKEKFMSELQNVIVEFFGSDPSSSPDYCKIINEKHFERLKSMILTSKGKKIGGKTIDSIKYIEPTLVTDISIDDPTMKDEIFGPVLPIIEFANETEVFSIIKKHEKPLALYYFGSNSSLQKNLLKQVQFGGGCINDTMVHVGSTHLPFGGIGPSGIGAYHGIYGFNLFSHRKSIMRKTVIYDLPVRYAPFSKFKLWLAKLLYP